MIHEAEVEHEAVRGAREREELAVLREDRDESSDGRASEGDELDARRELETINQKLRESEEAIVARDEEVLRLRGEVQREKNRYKLLWRMNCENLAEHDAALSAKEVEIEALRKQIRELTTVAPGEGTGSVRVGEGGHHHTPPETVPHPSGSTASTDPARRLEKTGVVSSREIEPRRILAESSRSSHRKGKAPSVDPFTGEDPEVRFVDWLPTLTRASQWNEWTPEESLMQLAGHLRGHALQE